MELYVVYFESANYAGYGEHCLVWADSVEDAMGNSDVSAYANDEEADVWASILSAVPLKGSEFEEFVAKQPEVYPIVNLK